MCAKRVDANQSLIVDALRAAGATVTPTHEHGQGFPDLCVGLNGRTYLLEVKVSKKSPLTDDEIGWHAMWRGHVAVVTTAEEALAVIGLHAAPIRRGERNWAQTTR